MHIDEIKDYWNQRANGFSAAVEGELDTENVEKWKEIFQTNINKEGAEVLDDGTGSGFFPVVLSSHGLSAGGKKEIRKNLTVNKNRKGISETYAAFCRGRGCAFLFPSGCYFIWFMISCYQKKQQKNLCYLEYRRRDCL